MAKRPRILTAEDVIHELDGDNYFLELDDPQEPVMPGSDDDFSDLKDINEDDEEGNYIHINNKVIFVVSIYQYSNFFLIFLENPYHSSILHPSISVCNHTSQQPNNCSSLSSTIQTSQSLILPLIQSTIVQTSTFIN